MDSTRSDDSNRLNSTVRGVPGVLQKGEGRYSTYEPLALGGGRFVTGPSDHRVATETHRKEPRAVGKRAPGWATIRADFCTPRRALGRCKVLAACI